MASMCAIKPPIFPIINQPKTFSAMYRSVKLKISSPVAWVGRGLHIRISTSAWYITQMQAKHRPAMTVDSSTYIAKHWLLLIRSTNSHSVLQPMPSILIETVEFESCSFFYSLQVIITNHAWNCLFYARYEIFGNRMNFVAMSNMTVHLTDFKLVWECFQFITYTFRKRDRSVFAINILCM